MDWAMKWPENKQAEEAVVGSILLTPEKLDEISELLAEADFYDPAMRTVYKHMLQLHDSSTPIDGNTLCSSLQTSKDLERAGGISTIAKIIEAVPSAANAVHYAKDVHEKARLRYLLGSCYDILEDIRENEHDVRAVLERAEGRIFKVCEDKGSSSALPSGTVFTDVIKSLEGPARDKGVATGLWPLDEILGGLRKSELVIIAARTSMGKTALATDICREVAVDMRRPTLVVTLEMTASQWVERMLSPMAEVRASSIQFGGLGPDEMERLREAGTRLKADRIRLLETPGQTVASISSAARRLKRQMGIQLLIIDYLQLIEPVDRRAPRQEQVAEISRRLKLLARQLDIPVIVLAQLNRQVEADRGFQPQLHNLRESGAIEQDADVVIMPHRPHYYDSSAREDLATMYVRKNRNGPTGEAQLKWLKDYVTFACDPPPF